MFWPPTYCLLDCNETMYTFGPFLLFTATLYADLLQLHLSLSMRTNCSSTWVLFTQQYQNQTNFEVTNRLPSAPIDSHKPISSGNKLRNFYNWLFVGYPIHEMVSILIFRIVIICWHLLLMCSYLHCDSKWFIFSDWKDALDSVQDVRALMAVGQTLSQCYK